MARSYKKEKYFANCNPRNSEKWDKQQANQKLRSKVKIKIALGEEVLLLLKDISNIAMFKKDGKYYWKNASKKDLRK